MWHVACYSTPPASPPPAGVLLLLTVPAWLLIGQLCLFHYSLSRQGLTTYDFILREQVRANEPQPPPWHERAQSWIRHRSSQGAGGAQEQEPPSAARQQEEGEAGQGPKADCAGGSPPAAAPRADGGACDSGAHGGSGAGGHGTTTGTQGANRQLEFDRIPPASHDVVGPRVDAQRVVPAAAASMPIAAPAAEIGAGLATVPVAAAAGALGSARLARADAESADDAAAAQRAAVEGAAPVSAHQQQLQA
jgi:hypothetical protein